MFLTGTGAEIMPVVKIDGRVIGNGKPGRLTRKLVDELPRLDESLRRADIRIEIMLCCICKEKEATVHLTQIVGDKMQKVDLCEECAKTKGVNDPTGFSLADLLLGLGARRKWNRPPAARTSKCPQLRLHPGGFQESRAARLPGMLPDIRRRSGGFAQDHAQRHAARRQSAGGVCGKPAICPTGSSLAEETRPRPSRTENFEQAAQLRDEIKQTERSPDQPPHSLSSWTSTNFSFHPPRARGAKARTIASSCPAASGWRATSRMPLSPAGPKSRSASRVLEIIRPAVESLPEMKDAFSETMDNLSALDKQILVERHLISREHAAKSAGSGLVLNREETLCVMINEEDHLRMQALASRACNCARRGRRSISWIRNWRRSSITPSTPNWAI